MKIDIGDKYVLTVDQYQYIVREKKIAKEGKNAGSEVLALVGYYPKIHQAISALINLDVNLSDVQSLQAMQQHIERVAMQCEKAFSEVSV
ncbi:DUF5405 family protein [Erwinia tracheiphila]|uniref:DUF5405 domain-containing protein n=1 Tax=Erwinia tracheiphila TaxID=65700 RepID=A0A0M2KJ00_9GAMM|nr:DUF5405 family protein [Erwinia tracheiphila]EOS94693.1 Orf83 [Erwinia tracheiphila PSU-1]KKF36971.1 hypothetical protein SY86_18545 [Erwinia tracheiphila]UIA88317.1 DUF5405 family protein [Erwinia tracheiphila]UIA96262.1 DUF5405 family protein [Erwinia tracheiphila]